MNRTQLLTTLRRLTATPTAPYDELEVRDVVHAIVNEHGLHFQTDAFGNTLVRVRRGMPRNKIAFVAHLDHPALRVVAKKGAQLVCKAEGGIPTVGLKDAKVLFPKCKDGAVSGRVVTAKVIKGTRPTLEQAIVQVAAKGPQPEIGDFAILDLPAIPVPEVFRWLAAGGSEGGLMAVAGWKRPDMLLRYTRAQASDRAASEARTLNLGDLYEVLNDNRGKK